MEFLYFIFSAKGEQGVGIEGLQIAWLGVGKTRIEGDLHWDGDGR